MDSLNINEFLGNFYVLIAGGILLAVFKSFIIPSINRFLRRWELLSIIRTDVIHQIERFEAFKLEQDNLPDKKALAKKGNKTEFNDPLYYFLDSLMTSFFDDYNNDIHLIPNELIVPLYDFYSSVEESRAFCEQFRSKEFQSMSIDRRFDAYKGWLKLLNETLYKGEVSLYTLRKYGLKNKNLEYLFGGKGEKLSQ